MVAVANLLLMLAQAPSAAVDVTGRWNVILHTPDAGDISATYILKQTGEKVSGTYDGPGGTGEITGTIKGNDVVLTVTVPGQRTGQLSGKLTSATKMNGSVTGWSSTGSMPWSAGKTVSVPTSAVDITGTWELTIHYEPDDRDYPATYVLRQQGEKIAGTYQGMFGPADVTGTVKSNEVTLSVTVKGSTAQFAGQVVSATKMSGTVTGTSDKPRKWTAEKKK